MFRYNLRSEKPSSPGPGRQLAVAGVRQRRQKRKTVQKKKKINNNRKEKYDSVEKKKPCTFVCSSSANRVYIIRTRENREHTVLPMRFSSVIRVTEQKLWEIYNFTICVSFHRDNRPTRKGYEYPNKNMTRSEKHQPNSRSRDPSKINSHPPYHHKKSVNK